MTNAALNTADFDYIAGLIKQRSGLALTTDKMYLLDSRLMPVARAHGCQTLSELVNKVRLQPNEALIYTIMEAMTTNESSFFRDTKPFDILRKELLPHFKAIPGKNSLRIWSAACSTGQEAYSTIISLLEEAPSMPGWKYELIGTDLAEKVLEKARKGLYSQFEAQRGMPIQLLVKYFNPQADTTWQVKDELRKMVQFKPLNLLENFSSLGKFDIVFCRNVLIYFDEATKNQVIARLAQSLNPGGVLILGSTETIMDKTVAALFTESSRGVYRLK